MLTPSTSFDETLRQTETEAATATCFQSRSITKAVLIVSKWILVRSYL